MLPGNMRLIPTLLMAVIMSATFSTTVLAEVVVRVGGAGSGLGMMKILAEAFEKSHPETKITIMPNLGSSGGIKALLHGAVDVAISGRALKPEELNGGAVAVECARTPFMFITNKNVGKADLTTRELEAIYAGQQLKWADGTRIRLILRPAGDTDTSIVSSISNGMEQAVKAANARQNMILAVTDQEAADMVSKTPGSLGGATLAQIETEKHPVKVLSFNGIKPTSDALAKGIYPLVKPLYLVSTRKTPAPALQFIQFAQSASGRAILTKYGALPRAGNKRTK